MARKYNPETQVLSILSTEDKLTVLSILDGETIWETAKILWPETYNDKSDEKCKRRGTNRAASKRITKKIYRAVEKIKAIRVQDRGLTASNAIPFTEELVKGTQADAMRILDKPIDVRSKYKELADPMLREKVILFYKTGNEKLKKEIICDIQDRAGYKPVEKIEHSAMDGKSVPELMNIIINNFFGEKNISKLKEVKSDNEVIEGVVIDRNLPADVVATE